MKCKVAHYVKLGVGDKEYIIIVVHDSRVFGIPLNFQLQLDSGVHEARVAAEHYLFRHGRQIILKPELIVAVELCRIPGHPKTQTMQTADCRPCRPCRLFRRLSTFLLFSFLHSLLPRIFFWFDHKLVFNYISECLFMKRPFYVTLAWYVTVDVLIDIARETPFSPKYAQIKLF